MDDLLAAIALEHRDAILARNRAIVRGNLAALDAWVAAEPSISFVRPQGGTIALLRYAFDLPSEALCMRLVEERGVLFTPGSAMDMEGYLRIGYANGPRVLRGWAGGDVRVPRDPRAGRLTPGSRTRPVTRPRSSPPRPAGWLRPPSPA